MKIMVMGSGLMGPAAAFNAMSDPQVSQVTLCDMNAQQLEAAQKKLAGIKGAEKLTAAVLDLNDQAAAVRMMAGCNAVVAALPKQAIRLGIQAAVAAKVPLVDLSWPPDPEVAELKRQVESARALVILGCGVEPGLTEIMARYLAEKLDRVDELHIKCVAASRKSLPRPWVTRLFSGDANCPYVPGMVMRSKTASLYQRLGMRT